MAALLEIHSFVQKFVTLCANGENANLSLQSKNGRITVDLQLHLHPTPPPPFYSTPPSRPRPREYQQGPSPSCVRRSQRRAAARAEKASAEVLDLANVIASEKAVIYSTPNEYATDEAENAVQTEQVVSSTEDVISDIEQGQSGEPATINKTVNPLSPGRGGHTGL